LNDKKQSFLANSLKDLKVPLEPDTRYIVNVGSVGQPRDGNPSAAYCVYDADKREVEVKRITYDIKTAQKKILEAGLPEFLAWFSG